MSPRVLALAAGLLAGMAQAAVQDAPFGRPDAIVDLSTRDGVRMVKGEWRYSDTTIAQIPGSKAYDYSPHAGVAGFDDSDWEVIDPTTLDKRRSAGRLSFNWYRFRFTVPGQVGKLPAAGTTIALELVLDDYAEIWVDGKLPLVLGQAGGHLVKGFNAPNRVILTRNAQPGQRIQVAIFGINGPVSYTPENFIWIRSATLDFYREGRAAAMRPQVGHIVRLDPALDAIVPAAAKIEKLADGFDFLEGPVWVPTSPSG